MCLLGTLFARDEKERAGEPPCLEPPPPHLCHIPTYPGPKLENRSGQPVANQTKHCAPGCYQGTPQAVTRHQQDLIVRLALLFVPGLKLPAASSFFGTRPSLLTAPCFRGWLQDTEPSKDEGSHIDDSLFFTRQRSKKLRHFKVEEQELTIPLNHSSPKPTNMMPQEST